MGKISVFLLIVIFVIIFPFFVKVENSSSKKLDFSPLEMTNGVLYEYNYSLKNVTKFSHLKEKKSLMYFSNVFYSDLENNYTLKAKKAIYNKNTKVLSGTDYIFTTPNMRGFGDWFKKEDEMIYATNSKFYIKD